MAGLVATFGLAQLARPSVPKPAPLIDFPDRSHMVEEGESGVFFEALVTSVVHQQLAGAAAQAIGSRLVAALGGRITAQAVMRAGHDELRSVGLSGSKAATLLGLAEAVGGASLDLGAMGPVGEEVVTEQLCRLRGIGPWTAQMFCLFTLGYLDVWPVTDLGVRKGYALAHGLDSLPSPVELMQLGELYRPYRSVAAWYLWRAADGPRPNPPPD